MPFAVGLWDSLFGKRITLEIPTCCGEIVKRSVTKRWYDLIQNESAAQSTNQQLVKVHMLDAVKGYRVLWWMMGDDVELVIAQKYRDRETGDLYAIHYFEDGEPKTEVLKREHWDMAYNKIQSW